MTKEEHGLEHFFHGIASMLDCRDFPRQHHNTLIVSAWSFHRKCSCVGRKNQNVASRGKAQFVYPEKFTTEMRFAVNFEVKSENFQSFSFCRALTICSIFVALFSVSNASTFDCRLDKTDWQYLGSKVRCNVESFSFNPPKKKDKIDHVEFISNEFLSPQVEIIEIINQICPYIPRGWRKFFKHSIAGLKIERSELRSLHAKDLKHFPKLVVLHLQGNFVEVLVHDLFAHTPHLKYINVRDNRITFVEPNAFDFLKNLIEIDFTNNICFDDAAYSLEATAEMMEMINVTCSRSGNPVMFSNIRRQHQLIFIFCLLFVIAIIVTFLGFCLLSQCLKRRGKAI